MRHPNRSDTELLDAHVAGDRAAFSELYGRHEHRLRRLARLTTGSHQDAEDALQEAMLAAHRAAGSFRHHAAVGSWLHRIVINACLDLLRRNRIPCTPLLEDYPAVGDRTAEIDTALVVRAALSRLPDGQRAAVVAVDMAGYSIADAARALGVAQGTVKSRCARGRARLAILLGRITWAADGAGSGRLTARSEREATARR